MNHTGCPMNRRGMVPFLAMLLSIVLLLSACGTKTENGSDNSSSKAGETAAPVPQSASATGKALDDAFAAGKVVFEQTDLRLPDLKTCEIILPPDSFWEAKQMTRPAVDDEFRSKLADLTITVFSYSPDGATSIGWIDSTPVAFSEDRVTILYPAKERGTEDRYNAAQTVYETMFTQSKKAFGTDREGIIWSPGGHYFCVINYTQVAMQNRAEYGSPVITDTRTGEMFCVDSFDPARSPDRQENGMWVTGCFSEDEQYFYAVYYGRRYHRTMLLRYDLQTCTADMMEKQASSDNDYYVYPAIAVQKDGTVNMLISARGAVREQSIMRVRADGTDERQRLTLFEDEALQAMTSARRMTGSGVSGEALLLYNGPMAVFRSSLMHIQMDDPAKGTDTVWIPKSDPLRLEAMVPSSLTGSTPEQEEAGKNAIELLNIIDGVLSPDGRYAAILAGSTFSGQDNNQGTVALMIIRLEDMTMLPAEASLLNQLSYRDINRYAKGDQYLLNWSEAGLLVVPAAMMFQVQSN